MGVLAVEPDQPEVEHLDEIVGGPGPADDQVRRLDVAVHQAVAVGVLQRRAGLAQQVHDPLRRERPVLPDQRFEVEPVQQLHHVVQPAVLRDTEIVELHGVRGGERGGRARFPLEAAHLELGVLRDRA